jgi:hypothetical protein
MKSIKQVTIGAQYAYTDKEGARAISVRVLERIENSKTAVIVREEPQEKPNSFYAHPALAFACRIKYLTARPLQEVQKEWIPGSRTEKTFEA